MQDISIYLIRYYVTLVECKQYVKAAATIRISQPALSKSINSLEALLGVKLINRQYHSFSLTKEGQLFYDASVSFLKVYDEYLNEMSARLTSSYSGNVRISAPSAVADAFFPDLIVAFRKKYPDITISVFIEDADQAVLSLVEGKTNLCLSLSPISIVSANSLCVKSILVSHYSVIFPDDHVFAEKDEVHLYDLINEDIMLPGETSRIRSFFLEKCKDFNVVPDVNFSCSQFGTLIALVRMRAGLAVLPEILLNRMGIGDLHHKPLSPLIPWNLTLVYPQNKYISQTIKCTCEFISDYFAELDQA